MANSSSHLFDLQKIDLRIDQIMSRLEKIADLLSNNPELVAAQAVVAAKKHEIQQLENQLSELEKNASTKKIKKEQSESSLYSGKNSNPKELSDLQVEIESLKRSIQSLEEEQLVKMAEIETLDKELSLLQQTQQRITVRNDADNVQLVNEKSQLEKELEKLQKERQMATGQISASDLQLYDRLHLTKNRRAVAAVEDQSCAICGSELTAADIQKARTSSSIMFCPACGRILYAG